MNIFSFGDYREFLNFRIKSLPGKSRGRLMQLAKYLGIHTSRLSRILGGVADFSLEQAHLLAQFFALNDLETQYFLLLIQKERAGSKDLKTFFSAQILQTREKSQHLASLIRSDQALTEEQKAIFYSSWEYSAIRLATSLPGCNHTEVLSARLGISKARVRKILDFLISTGLCVEKNSQVVMGPKKTLLEAESILLARHLANWRLKAMERHDKITEAELAYSALLSISKEDFKKLRAQIVEFIQNVARVAVNSDAETLTIMNIDWVDL